MIHILFQGDSITDGNRHKKIEQRWDLNHQIGHSYVYLIAAALGRKFPGRYHFINRGVSACLSNIRIICLKRYITTANIPRDVS